MCVNETVSVRQQAERVERLNRIYSDSDKEGIRMDSHQKQAANHERTTQFQAMCASTYTAECVERLNNKLCPTQT